MGGRGRKRARRAVNFLTGKRGFLTASTLLGAAGVAWGIYDSLNKTGATGATGATGPIGAPGPITTPGYATPPPIPGPLAQSGPPLPNDVVRVVRLAVSAARADGTLTPQERALILEHARNAGIESAVEAELSAPQPLADIVRGVSDLQRKKDLYVLAFSIVRADEAVSGAERIYLAQLAHQLGLDATTVAALEQDTATTIDQTPDTPPDAPQ
jgi:uncharacterized membrane protein YebE (DUF533 family)